MPTRTCRRGHVYERGHHCLTCRRERRAARSAPNAVQLHVIEFLAGVARSRTEAALDAPQDSVNAITREEVERWKRAIRASLSVRHGSWRAEDVEPYLKPLTSSLDPRTMGPNFVDVRGLSVIDLPEEVA